VIENALSASPFVIALSDEDRGQLEAVVRRRTAEHQMVLRAQIVLAAAGGEQNVSIAERLGPLSPDHAAGTAERGCAPTTSHPPRADQRKTPARAARHEPRPDHPPLPPPPEPCCYRSPRECPPDSGIRRVDNVRIPCPAGTSADGSCQLTRARVGSSAGAVAGDRQGWFPPRPSWRRFSAHRPGNRRCPAGLLRFQRPPIEPCMRFSRTRLTDVVHRRHSVFPASPCRVWEQRRFHQGGSGRTGWVTETRRPTIRRHGDGDDVWPRPAPGA